MYLAELDARKKNPVRVGVVGIGRMGRGVVDQVATMPGMRVMAAADVDLGRAEACLRENGADPLVTDKLGPAQDALRKGRPVATAAGTAVVDLCAMEDCHTGSYQSAPIVLIASAIRRLSAPIGIRFT